MSEAAPAAPAPGRGFAVTAGLDPGLAGELAALCERLGYGSLWSNDHGAADGLETLAALADGSSSAGLGIAGVDLERRPPAELAERVAQLGLDPGRLVLAVSPGAGNDPAGLLAAALPVLRAELPGASVLAVGHGTALAAPAPRFDGVLLEWMLPAAIAEARAGLLAAAGAAPGGRPAALVGYVRAAVGADAETRLARDEGFYRGSPAWREHFGRAGGEPGRTGAACDLPAQVPDALEPYAALLDTLVVRGLAAMRLPSLERIARAAAPAGGGPAAELSPAPAAAPARRAAP